MNFVVVLMYCWNLDSSVDILMPADARFISGSNCRGLLLATRKWWGFFFNGSSKSRVVIDIPILSIKKTIETYKRASFPSSNLNKGAIAFTDISIKKRNLTMVELILMASSEDCHF